jgi:protein-tyrosine phosphatase
MFAGRNPLTSYDVDVLAAQGITHILDLRHPVEWEPPRFGAEAVADIERRGLHRLNVPIRDVSEPTMADLDTACQFLEEALEDSNSRVYVHCRAGVERTAAILVAYYARHYGVSYEDALSRLCEGRDCLCPTWEQRDVVLRWLRT